MTQRTSLIRAAIACALLTTSLLAMSAAPAAAVSGSKSDPKGDVLILDPLGKKQANKIDLRKLTYQVVKGKQATFVLTAKDVVKSSTYRQHYNVQLAPTKTLKSNTVYLLIGWEAGGGCYGTVYPTKDVSKKVTCKVMTGQNKVKLSVPTKLAPKNKKGVTYLRVQSAVSHYASGGSAYDWFPTFSVKP